MEHISLYLKDIYFSLKKGQLVFQRGGIQKYFYFQDGELVYVKTNQPQELLGEVLFGLGKISKKVYSRIEDYIVPRRALGEVLMEQGLISKEDLRIGLIRQMQDAVLNLFHYFEGEFRFLEKEDFRGQDFEIRINIPILIEEGIRRMRFDQPLRDFMKTKIPFPKEERFLHRLTKEENDIFRKIEGTSSAEAILRSSGADPDVFWKSLFLFYCLGLIDVKAGKEGEPSKAAAKKEDFQEAKIEEVLAFREQLSRSNYYQILNVSRSATLSDIKKAYFLLAKKYHPDLFDRDLPPEIKEKIDDVFDQITKSFQTLSDEKKKRDYDEKVDFLHEDARKERPRKAEVKFRQGKTLYDQGRYEDAMILLEEAIRLDNTKASHFLLLAMTQSKIPFYLKKAEFNFLKAIELEPWSLDNYVALGLMYKGEGLFLKAAKQFKRALNVDSDHVVALRELDSMGMIEKKKGLKDFLSFYIFGKSKKR